MRQYIFFNPIILGGLSVQTRYSYLDLDPSEGRTNTMFHLALNRYDIYFVYDEYIPDFIHFIPNLSIRPL